MSLKKLIVCHFVLTATPPDSIWLAGAAIHRLGLLGESAATMRKTIPAADADCGDFAIWAILTALLGGTILIPSSGDVLKTEVAIEDVVHLGGLTAQTEVDAMVFIDEADIAIAVERHG